MRISKNELGLFCAQYGYDNHLSSLAKQEKFYSSKKKRLSKKYSNFKEESFYRKPKHNKHSNKKILKYSLKKIYKMFQMWQKGAYRSKLKNQRNNYRFRYRKTSKTTND